MSWFDVDGARSYLTRPGLKPPSRKVIYKMVTKGLRVSRHGHALWFCEAWIDEYMRSNKSSDAARFPRRAAGKNGASPAAVDWRRGLIHGR